MLFPFSKRFDLQNNFRNLDIKSKKMNKIMKYIIISKNLQISIMIESIELTSATIQKFKPAKIIKDHLKDIVGIDFSNDGEILYVADCQTLSIYATKTGQLFRRLYMKIHQIQQISHTHNNRAVLIATKKNNLILYWSIHENKVIKMFKGHTDTISNLVICPKDDTFITTSNDNTMRLWNINNNGQECDFKLNVESESMSAYPVANFDPTGVVFGVAWSEQQKQKQIVRICLYAVHDCETGPFADWKRDYNEIKVMRFSNDGEYILMATSDNSLILLDAFEGSEKYKFTNFINQSSIIECSFSPDSKFIVSGSENGTVHVWSTTNGEEVVKLNSHVEKVSYARFSPNQCLLVSAGRNVTWWLPDLKQANK